MFLILSHSIQIEFAQVHVFVGVVVAVCFVFSLRIVAIAALAYAVVASPLLEFVCRCCCCCCLFCVVAFVFFLWRFIYVVEFLYFPQSQNAFSFAVRIFSQILSFSYSPIIDVKGRVSVPAFKIAQTYTHTHIQTQKLTHIGIIYSHMLATTRIRTSFC